MCACVLACKYMRPWVRLCVCLLFDVSCVARKEQSWVRRRFRTKVALKRTCTFLNIPDKCAFKEDKHRG